MLFSSLERQERTVMSLEMALKAAVSNQKDDCMMARIAEKNGFNLTTFRNSLNPTTLSHKANIYHLEAVLSETRDTRLMDSMCAIHGNAAWFELPVCDGIAESEFLKEIAKLSKESADLANCVVEALADGVITQDELNQVYKATFDLIRVASKLFAMVRWHQENVNV